MASNSREIEIKLSVESAREARSRLLGAGFQLAKKRLFEKNTLYDTEGFDLRRSSCLLRVREAGTSYKLTFKGVPEVGKYKSREEIETDIDDGPAFEAILARLGYSPVFRYEKYRTEFEAQGGKGVATLDETPIGTYLELEGDPDWIDRTARKLGYEEKDYITASYGRLFLEWKERTGSPAGEMVFSKSVDQ